MTPLIGFAPDVDPTTPGAILDGNGFSPTQRGIEGTKSWRKIADMFDPTVYGTALAAFNTVESNFYVATDTHVLHIVKFTDVQEPVITDITPSSYQPIDVPQFYRFGDYVILTGGFVAYQTSNPTTQMTAISGAQRYVGFARGFYHVRAYFNEWFTSDEGDPTDFTVGSGSAAQTGTFPDADGNINEGASLGEFAVLYKAGSIWLGRSVGPPVYWAWERVPSADGCKYMGSLVALRDAHYYWGPNNIFRFDLGRPQPIGNAVRNWLQKWIDIGYTRIQAQHSPVNDSILWAMGYPTSQFAGDRRLLKTLEYHIPTGRFGVQDVELDCLVKADEKFFLGRLPVSDGPHDQLYAMRDGALYARDGTAGSSEMLLNLYGNEDQDTSPGRVRVHYTKRPGAATLTHYVREFADGDVVKTQISENANGQHDIRASGKWHQDRIVLSGDYVMRGTSNQAPRVEGRR